MLKKGSKQSPITGEVYTVPFPIKIISNYQNYRAGEKIYLLTYQGEGQFKIWYKGRVIDGQGNLPVEEIFVNGKFPQDYKSTWWVKFRLHNGQQGWTKQTENFDGFDRCS
ncbi:MAG: hypothetical protein SFU25_10435 [Candidatus Caenarcaniphilales bacterium]|nr:hypothetical protein [Candidatus Caenarcaniphilales bacterium]